MADYAFLNKLNKNQIEGILIASEFDSDVSKIGKILDNVRCEGIVNRGTSEPLATKPYPEDLARRTFLRDSLETLVNQMKRHMINEAKRGHLAGVYETYDAIANLVEGDDATMTIVIDFLTRYTSGKPYVELPKLIDAFNNLRCRKLTI